MNIFKRLKKEESGQILILSLIFLLFGSLTLPPMLNFTFTELDTTIMYQENTKELYTCDAARAGFEEGIKGTIAPGKVADLVLLNRDPTRVPPDEIKDIEIEMTILNGEIVWRRSG